MFEDTKDIFNRTKSDVLNLIKCSKDEITCKTKVKKSGIYMIYIDNFTDSKILPIYVGKTVNIQHRYKEHYKEILSLNRLSYDTYSLYNDKGLYDGAFKSCKIFKYMVDHNCSLKDYHIIVLEYCDEDKLEEREQFYIQTFKSEYFGFNQLNSKTLWIPYSIASVRTKEITIALKYILAVQENCSNIDKFFDYGYTEFNYNYAFHYSAFQCHIENSIIEKELSIANQKIIDLTSKINSSYIKQKISNDNAVKKLLEELHNLKDDKQSMQKYDDLNKIKKERKLILKALRQKFLFIEKPYKRFPLNDNPIVQELNNEIYFTISNDGKNNRPAEIIKISYNINGINREHYIENTTTINSQKGLEYIEKLIDFSYLCGFQKEVYKIIPKNCSEDYRGLIYPKHISIGSEYKTGINDYSIQHQSLKPLQDVIKEIIDNIKPNYKIKISSSESKKLLDELLENNLPNKLYTKFVKTIK